MAQYYRSSLRLRQVMTATCFLLVLYVAGVMLAASLYIVRQGQAASFLAGLSHAPRDPLRVYLWCFGLCTVLSYLVLNTTQEKKSAILALALAKTLLACWIIWLLNMSCSSLLLLVFSDILYSMRRFRTRQMLGVSAMLIVLYLLFSYPVMNPLFPMADPAAYFEVFGRPVSGILVLVRSLLEGFSLLLFIAFMCLFIADQYRENENIAQELHMVSRVNENLQAYAQVTERIGEHNERKRLAREIHDTLGHALTGIAAGIDATMVIMDKNPAAAREQLVLVREVVSEGIGDVRSSLQKLRPGALEQKGLQGALEKMIREFRAVSGMEIELLYEAQGLDFEKVKEDVCFRLVQESLTNARRHGSASRVTVAFTVPEAGWLKIRIQDNGSGASQIVRGYGLTQMEENVSSIHGTVRFDGSCGFITEARIPMGKGEWNDQSSDCR